jgi:hypothetical protein
MGGLALKREADETVDRIRRFLQREMQDGILATLPVRVDAEREWQEFRRRWHWAQYQEASPRPFPSPEEVFAREQVGLEARHQATDDALPVVYSILDAGESMVRGLFGQEMRFYHREGAAYSDADLPLPDYARLAQVHWSLGNTWAQRFLDIQRHFRDRLEDRFAQHACLTMDALNFACEMRGATQAYADLYEHPEALRQLLEIGLDFNVEFQEAQQQLCGGYAEGSFCWISGWTPFPRAISLSVDAYTVCLPRTYVEFGFDYQRRLIEHFGHGLMHFHCNRLDLAREVVKLPGLELLQFGGDPHDPVPSHEYLPSMRALADDLPMQVWCPLPAFLAGLDQHTLLPNVWYTTGGDSVSVDEANRIMEAVRAYRA